ncbi:MAG: hypothetical protein EHM19_01915, partial [Candidatus Latescibacterota bacterium]
MEGNRLSRVLATRPHEEECMSGMAGCVRLRSSDSTPDRLLVERMLKHLSHRAPEGTGIIDRGGVCVGAALRRARSADEPSSQPIVSDDGNRWIVLDGILFNRDAIRKELEEAGIRFRAGSDAEVALQAWARWGTEIAGRIDGMFAFAAGDESSNTVLLARDPYGVKPLHYAIRDGRLLFASEIKALLAGGPSPAPNKRAVLEWLLHGDLLAPETLFEGILALPPGHMLVMEGAADPHVVRYYDACDHVDAARHDTLLRMPPHRFVDELHAALRQSVSACVGGEDRVGVLLSGGLDSALTTALAAKSANTIALHASVADDPSLDERSAAEETARALGVPFSCVSLDRRTFLDRLAPCTLRNEMPLWHTQYVAFDLLAKRARDEGLRVLLCGSSLGTMLGATGGRRSSQKWIWPAARFLRPLPWKVVRGLEKLILAHRGGSFEAPGYTRRLVPTSHLVDGYARDSLLRRCRNAYAFLPGAAERGIQATRVADLSLFLHRFFHRADRLAMTYQVEHRNPFQDTDSVHLAINMPLSIIFRRRTDKWPVLEVAARYLPGRCIHRPKVAWALPSESYLRSVATPDFFRKGFCEEFFRFEASPAEVLLDRWQGDGEALFAFVAI